MVILSVSAANLADVPCEGTVARTQTLTAAELASFIMMAHRRTYAGSGRRVPEAHVQIHGLKEYHFADGPLDYRDSYGGSTFSGGITIVRFRNKPVWFMNYGGGMVGRLVDDRLSAEKTFAFLKETLLEGASDDFRPRGPAYRAPTLVQGTMAEYLCNWTGSVRHFSGMERILLDGVLAFTHTFFGGVYVRPGEEPTVR